MIGGVLPGKARVLRADREPAAQLSRETHHVLGRIRAARHVALILRQDFFTAIASCEARRNPHLRHAASLRLVPRSAPLPLREVPVRSSAERQKGGRPGAGA